MPQWSLKWLQIQALQSLLTVCFCMCFFFQTNIFLLLLTIFFISALCRTCGLPKDFNSKVCLPCGFQKSISGTLAIQILVPNPRRDSPNASEVPGMYPSSWNYNWLVYWPENNLQPIRSVNFYIWFIFYWLLLDISWIFHDYALFIHSKSVWIYLFFYDHVSDLLDGSCIFTDIYSQLNSGYIFDITNISLGLRTGMLSHWIFHSDLG